MGTISAKDLFRHARENEKAGQYKLAASNYAKLARHLNRKGKYEEAKKILLHALDISPSSARLYVLLAAAEIHLGSRENAKEAMRECASGAVQNKKIDDYSAYLDVELQSFPALRKVFYQALLELDRTRARPFIALAKICSSEKDYDGAKRMLLDALRTKTADQEAVQFLRDVLEVLGFAAGQKHLDRFEQKKLSRKDLIELLSADFSASAPPEPAEKVAPEKNLRGLIEDLEKELGINVGDGYEDVDGLVKEFRRKADQVIAGDAKANMDMALAFYEMGLFKDAREQIARVPAGDPRFAEAQALLGEILIADGSDLAALEIYKNSLRDERAPLELNLDARYKTIQIYLRLGDMKQAAAQARELEKKSPNYRGLKLLLAELGLSGTAPRAGARAAGRKK